jgi:hypothetical protein
MVLEKNGKDQLDRLCKKKLSIKKSQVKRSVLQTTKRREANRIGHILHRNCLVRQVFEGQIEGDE